MNILFKCKTIELDTINYGKIKINVDRKNKIGNGYYVETTINDKKVAGYIDSNYNEIVELDERELVEEFHTKGYYDICLKFKIEDKDDLECYHINNDDKKLKVVHVVGPYSENKYEIINADDKDYWLLKRIYNDDEEYAVYDIHKRAPITSYFDVIEIITEDENPYHTIFYQRNIKTNIFYEESCCFENITHTAICGFLDSEGNFSSQILDQEEEMFYSTNNLGGNTFSPLYDKFVEELRKSYLDEHFEKESRVDQYITYLALHPNIFNKTEEKKKTKIINFNSRK